MSETRPKSPAPSASAGSRGWGLLLVGVVLLVTAAEAVLLELGGTFFSSGYNATSVDTPLLIASFFASSLTVDLFLVSGIWLVSLPLLRRVLGRGPTLFVTVAVLSLGIPAVYDLLRYRLLTVVGDAVSVSNLIDLAGGSAVAIATEVALQLEGGLVLVVAVVPTLVLTLWLTHRADRRWPAVAGALGSPPSVRSIAMLCAATGAIGTAIFALPGQGPERIRTGLLDKPGGLFLIELVRKASDVDLDGFGFLSRPADPAPFDASVHPFALDLPGNDMDENGMAGDLPPDFQPVSVESAPLPDGAPRRHLLVILLESFRGDLLESSYEGQEVTPFMNRLAEDGGRSLHAYVHTPATVASRAQLFGGRLDWKRTGRTWVDDFKARGYRVAHFSGQDDTLSRSAEYMGTDGVDVYYDARSDSVRRTSRTRNSLSLQVSWKTLSSRVEAFLADHDPAVPLFLYVNLVDTHFPYHHDEMDDVLGTVPIPRHEISRDRVDEVLGTYANAAANVDRGVERIVNAWWSHLGRDDGGILITADHGQSFYENGVLGHGQFLDESHTRVPFVVWGMGGSWPEPLGLADVRALVRRNLPLGDARGIPQPRFVPDPSRWIFQFTPRLERPRLVQLRSLDSTVEYPIGGRGAELGGEAWALRLSNESPAAFEGRMAGWVVHNWEALLLRSATP